MKISIIIPVYNSSPMLTELCERIFKTMKELNFQNNFELIMINDCSQDNSWQKINDLSRDLLVSHRLFKYTILKLMSSPFGEVATK